MIWFTPVEIERELIGVAGPPNYPRKVYACRDSNSTWVEIEYTHNGTRMEFAPDLASALGEYLHDAVALIAQRGW